jgi:Ca-activated chloride channel family protein
VTAGGGGGGQHVYLGGAGLTRGARARPAAPGGAAPKPQTVTQFARQNQRPDDLAKLRDGIEAERRGAAPQGEAGARLAEAAAKKQTLDRAKEALAQRRHWEVQAGKLGVDLAVEANGLRNQSCLTPAAVKQVAGRNCLEVGGVWMDEGFEPAMPTVVVKAQSAAYFRLLERHPRVKEVLRLGNHLLWVTPSRTALVIDTSEGCEALSDAVIDALFVAKK